MKKIKLTQSKTALVDDWNFEELNQYYWIADKGKNTYYARRRSNKSLIRMHRVIMKTPEGMEVDHADHNGLNNQEYNMRNVSLFQNAQNRSDNNIYIGVTYNKLRGYFQSTIGKNRKKIHLGVFYNVEDAARSYNAAIIKYYGDHPENRYNEITIENTLKHLRSIIGAD